jgi:FAD synthase
VEFVDLIRPQAVFDSLDDYLTQIAIDVSDIERLLST